jgi:hypothetical protein
MVEYLLLATKDYSQKLIQLESFNNITLSKSIIYLIVSLSITTLLLFLSRNKHISSKKLRVDRTFQRGFIPSPQSDLSSTNKFSYRVTPKLQAKLSLADRFNLIIEKTKTTFSFVFKFILILRLNKPKLVPIVKLLKTGIDEEWQAILSDKTYEWRRLGITANKIIIKELRLIIAIYIGKLRHSLRLGKILSLLRIK